MTPVEQTRMIDALNRYCFHNIWNATLQEYRVNVKPNQILAGRYLKGSVSVGSERFPLPTPTDQYIAYYAPQQSFFGGLRLQKGVWIRSDTFLTHYKTLLYSYDTEGRVLPRNSVYLYLSPISNRVIIALLKNPLLKVFGPHFDAFYMTVYRDSDQPNPITLQTWYVDPTNASGSVNGLVTFLSQSKTKNFEGTQILINGREFSQSNPLSYQPGDYIEILCDENVIGAYDVNVSNNTTGFYSDIDSKYKEILHCPKTINPNNQLITHNTCMLSILTSEGIGRYVHRIDDVGVGQITHNDLSITTDVVDAYRTYLNDQDLKIHVRVRTHTKDNVLINDLFYVSFLYICSDEDILKHLRGELDNTLSFWKASSLENSFYTRMMFDTPNSTDKSVLDEYIAGLGYYTVAAILSNHVTTFKTGNMQRQFRVYKPVALIGKSCYPMVYLRGYKLQDDQFTYGDQYSHSVRITLSDDVYLGSENDLVIALIENGSGRPYVFTPDVSHTTITVPFRDVRIFEELTTSESVKGYRVESFHRYIENIETPGSLSVTDNGDGTTTLLFGLSNYNKTFIIQNRNFSVNISTSLDDMIFTEKGSLTLPLQITCMNDTDKVVPLLGYNTVDAYMNSLKLVDNLDISVNTLKDSEDRLAGYEISLNTLDYLKEAPGNILQTIVHTGTQLSNEAGFVYNGTISFDNNINLWYPNISRAYVKGLLVSKLEDFGTYLVPNMTTHTGDAYKIEVHLLGTVAELLDGYSSTPDINRINTIRAYFNRILEVDKSVVVVDRSHLIFSNYVAQITRDLAQGVLEVANDPDDVRFLVQFNTYRHLRDIDTALKDMDIIDLTYTGIYGTYTNFSVSPEIRKIILRFEKLVLPSDPNSLGGL
jgi:hypothetical protein